MLLHNWLQFLDILSAIVWPGGSLVRSIFGSRARESSNPQVIPDFAQILTYIVVWDMVFQPGLGR